MKGASSTARLIAACIVLQDERGIAERWLPVTTIALSRATLRSSGVPGRVLLAALGVSWIRKFFVAFERQLQPGMLAHFLLRKHCIANWAEQAITAGASQILILGAGMDGLGPELCQRHAGLQVVELDHPATQAVKRRALEQVAPGTRTRLLAIDLSGADLHRQIDATRLSREGPTLVVAEGLLMYLLPRNCLRLLEVIAGHFHGRLDVVFSVMENDSRGRPGFTRAHPLIDHWLSWRGEPFRWACDPARLAKVLERAGLRVQAMHRGDELPTAEFPDWSPCIGETLYFASRSD